MTQERTPETPRAQASENVWKDQQAEYLAAKHREAVTHNEAVAAAHIAARETWRTVRLLQSPDHSAGPLAGLQRGDIAGIPPGVAEHFVKVGVATYELDPASPAAPEVVAQQRASAARTETPELFEVAKSFSLFEAGERAGFTPTAAAPLLKSGHLRVIGSGAPVRTMVGRTLDAARRALAGC